MTTRGRTPETLEVTISQGGLTVKVAGRQIALSAIAALTPLGVIYLCVIF
jgi:hypothetical protein